MERRKNTNRIQTKSTLPVRVLSRPLAVKSSLVSHGSCFTCYNHCHCSSFHNLSFLSSFQLSPQQERKRPLTVWSKVCFAVGGAPYQITGTALGFFLQIFLLDVALVSVCIYMGMLYLNAEDLYRKTSTPSDYKNKLAHLLLFLPCHITPYG